MPVLPFIEDTDENILKIISLAKNNGAKFIYSGFGVTLRQNQRDQFLIKLNEHFPGLAKKYIDEYGHSYECHSKRAKELRNYLKMSVIKQIYYIKWRILLQGIKKKID